MSEKLEIKDTNCPLNLKLEINFTMFIYSMSRKTLSLVDCHDTCILYRRPRHPYTGDFIYSITNDEAIILKNMFGAKVV